MSERRQLNPEAATIQVVTRRRGVLAKVGHDLLLQLRRFELTLDAGARDASPSGRAQSIVLRADTHSFYVVAALSGDTPAPAALSDRDKRKIERSLVNDVLHSEHFPEAEFQGEAQPRDAHVGITGMLTLHGHSRTLSTTAHRESWDNQWGWFCELSLHQPDFGIKPYSALLGSLEVHPDVQVRVWVPEAAP